MDDVIDHDVLDIFSAVPIEVEPAYKVMVSPITPVPDIVGVVSLVGLGEI